MTDADVCQLSTHLPLTLILMVISTGLFYVNGGSIFGQTRHVDAKDQVKSFDLTVNMAIGLCPYIFKLEIITV